MIELYLSKVTETSESEQAGKLYARVTLQYLSILAEDFCRHAHNIPSVEE